MAERLFELKMQREGERQAQVEEANERRFRDTADDLRKEDSKFYVKQCAIERETQMKEKKDKFINEIREE